MSKILQLHLKLWVKNLGHSWVFTAWWCEKITSEHQRSGWAQQANIKLLGRSSRRPEPKRWLVQVTCLRWLQPGGKNHPKTKPAHQIIIIIIKPLKSDNTWSWEQNGWPSLIPGMSGTWLQALSGMYLLPPPPPPLPPHLHRHAPRTAETTCPVTINYSLKYKLHKKQRDVSGFTCLLKVPTSS